MKLFPTVADLYIKETGAIRTPSSRGSYRKIMRLLQSVYPHHNVDDFTTDDLSTFCVSRYDGKPGLAAPATIKNRRAHIRSTFEWAAYKKFTPGNPALDLKFTVRPGRGSVRTHTWLTEEQVAEIYNTFDAKDDQALRDRIIIMIGVLTGLRVFELEALRWSNFSEDLSTLKIVGKGDKPETLAVPAQLQTDLIAWKKKRWQGSDVVFPTFRWQWNPGKGKRTRTCNWDQPLGDAGFRYAIMKAGGRCGITLKPHDLRRSFAGILEAKGVPLKDISRAMRHSNVGTTDTYLEKNPAKTVAVTKGLTIGGI